MRRRRKRFEPFKVEEEEEERPLPPPSDKEGGCIKETAKERKEEGRKESSLSVLQPTHPPPTPNPKDLFPPLLLLRSQQDKHYLERWEGVRGGKAGSH